ncbi:MAG: class I SAM-dependent methyltransferase [Chromatiales bacterium]|nr:class I SAM-dependent methyltransferase [Chromatiales bacterium]
MNNDSLDWYDPIIEDLPEHLAGSDSWTGHIPFAFYLMAALRPAHVVELGVFAGNSLFAFAQAAQKLALPVRISGVDTWESDPHSGGYDGAAVYQMVLEQQARYPDRVELHQASFDQARAAFAPESVDLLHIDGYHHYEAVSHDFLTWRETLTRAGVVLFHDIAVRRDDFGVWRFWDEIKREYGPEQTLEFTHSNGLGVLLLAPVDRYPERMQSLLDAYRNAPETVRTLFRLAGQRVQDVFAARERQRQAGEKIAGLEEASANWQREALHQQQEVARRQQDIANWREEALRQQQEVLHQQREVLTQQQEALHHQQEALNWRLECQSLTTRLETIYQSKSWRLTAPLRSVRYTLRFRSGPSMSRFAQRLKNALTYIRHGEWSELRRRLAFLRHGGMEAASGTLDARHWTIVTPPHGNYVASLLAKRLRALGMTVELLNAMPDSFGNGYYVVLAAQMFDRLPPGHQLYLYQLEQTQASNWFSKRYLHRLEHCRAVLEYKLSNMEYLAERGIVFPHVYALPIGGNPELFQDDPGGDFANVGRPVLFYGAWKANPRRTQLLEALSSDVELQREDNLFAPELYARIQAQMPRPVVLNLHHYDPAQLETPRLWEAVSLGALVVSEDSADRDEDPWLASAIDTIAAGDLPGLRQALKAAERGLWTMRRGGG